MTTEKAREPRVVDVAQRVAAVRQAADSEERKNIVVTAGAGTGKTSLLIERILHLVLESGMGLDRLAAITFTEKASAEMRERLEEALETVCTMLAGESDCADGSDEAQRVLERLATNPALSQDAILDRAYRSLELLDTAALTTIHSFAADVLRRHPGEAGVDPDFQVDEGTKAREVFRDVWCETLRRIFEQGEETSKHGGSETIRDAWERLLDRFSIGTLELIARQLSDFKVPIEALEDAGLAEQEELLMRCLRNDVDEVRRLIAAVTGVRGLHQAFLKNLTRLEEIFQSVLEERVIWSEERLKDIGLNKTCSVGKNVELDEKQAKDVGGSMARLLKSTWALCEVDLDLPRDVATALYPIVSRTRKEFLRRGWMSYDAMITLTRDLLRDHVSVRREEANRFDHILIDEFQDTDPQQYEIAFFLAEKDLPEAEATRDALAVQLTPGKLFIVGDAKQSIYRFRGADIKAFQSAVQAIATQGGESHSLRTNFRSVPDLVNPLNLLFGRSFAGGGKHDPVYEDLVSAVKPRELPSPCIEIWSVGEAGILAREGRSLESEAIADWIETEISEGRRRARDVAVLLRALTKVDFLLRALRRRDIPYVVEGGSEFYKRYEVELLLSFLRSITNTADGIALVTWLRSPAAAVPDVELQGFATARAGSPQKRPGTGTWSIYARPDAQIYPNLSRALEELRGFATRYHGQTLDVVARAALSETTLRAAMAASYEGAQRVANLDKAVRRVTELASDATLSAGELLDRLDQEATSRSSEGDSSLADETIDAVRVLSIHKAKGLEWPVVVLPELAAKPGGGRERESVLVDVFPPRSLVLKTKKCRSPAYSIFKRENTLHEEAESRRIFYVATTRAREQLVLFVGPHAKKSATPWIRALGAWGYSLAPDGAFPTAESFAEGAVRHVFLRDVREKGRSRKKAGLDHELLRAVKEFDAACVRAAAAVDPVHHPGSERDENDPGDSQQASASGSLSEPRDPRVARAAGEAVHLLLEVWDRVDESWLLENVDGASRVAASHEHVNPRSVAAESLTILRRARDEGKLGELARLSVIGAEWPVLFRGGDGKIWEGKIDLLVGEASAPEVVDFKTNRTESQEELDQTYSSQIERYAEGVQRSLGRKSEVPARIFHLPPDGK